MRDAEAFARQPIDEIAGDRLTRRETDGVDEPVETVPRAAEVGEHRGDLVVAADVAREDQRAAELRSEAFGALPEALADIREREFGAFTMAGPCDAVGDGTVGQDARDEDAFAGQKAHEVSRCWTSSRDVVAA